MDALRGTIDDIFYGAIIVPLGLALILFQLVVLVVAVRRRRRGRPLRSLRLHAIAGLSILPLPVLIGFSVHAARATMLAAFTASEDVFASEKAMALSHGMAGQMSAFPFATSTIVVSLALWSIGLATTLSASQPEGRARSFPPVALIPIGLAPLALGVVNWSARLIKTFAAMAGIPPQDKGTILEGTLEIARGELTAYARVSMIAIPVLTLAAGVLTVMRARGGAPASDATAAAGRSWRLPLLASAAAIVLAGLLVLEARPIAAENALPWPPNRGNLLVYPNGPATPDLIGPDPMSFMPVVEQFRDHVMLDRAPLQDLGDLEERLTTLRNNYQLLHPGGDSADVALILVDAATPSARLTALMRAVRGAWFYRPTFGFTKTEHHDRPVIGNLERVIVTGAQIKLEYTDDEPDADDAGAWKDAVELRLKDFADYDAFARRLVELRRAGKPVVVKVPRSAG